MTQKPPRFEYIRGYLDIMTTDTPNEPNTKTQILKFIENEKGGVYAIVDNKQNVTIDIAYKTNRRAVILLKKAYEIITKYENKLYPTEEST